VPLWDHPPVSIDRESLYEFVDRVPTAPIAATGLIGGFAVAVASGSRPLGGAVMAVLGIGCIAVWLRRDGRSTAVKLTATGLLAFAISHVLGLVIGAWPSVIVAGGCRTPGVPAWRSAPARARADRQAGRQLRGPGRLSRAGPLRSCTPLLQLSTFCTASVLKALAGRGARAWTRTFASRLRPARSISTAPATPPRWPPASTLAPPAARVSRPRRARSGRPR
jgi:hypothetical protein